MMPAGVLLTVPLPVPVLLRVTATAWRSKVAVTVVAAFVLGSIRLARFEIRGAD